MSRLIVAVAFVLFGLVAAGWGLHGVLGWNGPLILVGAVAALAGLLAINVDDHERGDR